MENILIIAVVLAIVGLAVGYVIRAKKRGAKCIGCPEGSKCGQSACGGCTGCGSYSCGCRKTK